MKYLTIKKAKKLQQIINKTRKKRIKYKLIKRIANGTFDCFCAWLGDEEAHNTIDHVIGSICMPNSVELLERYN